MSPHIRILGDILKPLGELFDSVEVSADADVLHTSYRSDMLNVVNLFGDSGDDYNDDDDDDDDIDDNEDNSQTTSMMVAFLFSQSLMT